MMVLPIAFLFRSNLVVIGQEASHTSGVKDEVWNSSVSMKLLSYEDSLKPF